MSHTSPPCKTSLHCLNKYWSNNVRCFAKKTKDMDTGAMDKKAFVDNYMKSLVAKLKAKRAASM